MQSEFAWSFRGWGTWKSSLINFYHTQVCLRCMDKWHTHYTCYYCWSHVWHTPQIVLFTMWYLMITTWLLTIIPYYTTLITLRYISIFTSNTQLVFLSGKHHLHTDLIVDNVVNLTFEGNGQKEMYNTIIYCTWSAQVFINNSHNINFRYLIVNGCGVSKIKRLVLPTIAMDILNCSNTSLLIFFLICHYRCQCGLAIVNTVGNNLLYNITSSFLLVSYKMTRNNDTHRWLQDFW